MTPGGLPLSDPLAELRGYHPPDPVSWWPPAPGWWLLALLILGLLTWVTVWAVAPGDGGGWRGRHPGRRWTNWPPCGPPLPGTVMPPPLPAACLDCCGALPWPAIPAAPSPG